MKDFNYTGPKAPGDNASAMPDIRGKQLLVGYWQNWGPSGGYQGGLCGAVELKDIPQDYNVVVVSFMTGAGIPTFRPYNQTDEVFRRQVGELNQQGRAVLISLGGADSHIALYKGQEQAFASEIIRLVEVYGFDGLDIDLEQSAVNAADNNTVIPAALKLVREYYAAQGSHFIISMAPEFPYLRVGQKYVPYLVALEGVYDFIAPQYYNQWGDGIDVPGHTPSPIRQDDDLNKEAFLYYLTTALVTGTSGFVRIPADKFVIGLPSNVDAANNGFVTDPAFVKQAFAALAADGNAIRGLMTWSINWDCGANRQGVPYNWSFMKSYKDLIN
ncbi:glycosyl hydrolase family 18 protein [Pseudomonas purpurea]